MYKYEQEIIATYKKIIKIIPHGSPKDISRCIRQNLKAYTKVQFVEYFEIDENRNLVYAGNKLRTLDFDCIHADNENAGLYFIGMAGFNPLTDERYYLVKVGCAMNIRKRIKQYLTHNPMIYHNNIILPISEADYPKMTVMEDNCHRYLKKCAYAKAAGSKEWFYVSRETYLQLCEKFANRRQFLAIALAK